MMWKNEDSISILETEHCTITVMPIAGLAGHWSVAVDIVGEEYKGFCGTLTSVGHREEAQRQALLLAIKKLSDTMLEITVALNKILEHTIK